MENENVKIIKCSLIQADHSTANERIYPKEILEKAIKEYNNQRETNLGIIFDRNKNLDAIDLTEVSHEVLHIWLDDDNFINCKIKILDTMPYGKILKEMWSENIEIFPVFRVILDEGGEQIKEIYNMDIHVCDIKTINNVFPVYKTK